LRKNLKGYGKEMFKVGLLMSDDPHFTRPSLDEGKDYWYVEEPKMSSAFAIHAKKSGETGIGNGNGNADEDHQLHP